MEPFDLESALAHHPVCLSDGTPVIGISLHNDVIYGVAILAEKPLLLFANFTDAKAASQCGHRILFFTQNNNSFSLYMKPKTIDLDIYVYYDPLIDRYHYLDTPTLYDWEGRLVYKTTITVNKDEK